ncbi:MAG: cobalamin-dependent protein, partial [Candidatus Omnitrophica bacterium]|nr:cobalamin-dependent protein [Candidatus Omnitrophota bacterium]
MGNLNKRISLRIWLADLTHTGMDARSIGVDTFPLAVGCIATYAESKLLLSEPVRIFRYPHKLAQALVEEGSPDIIGFSNFIWNLELSLAFGRRIKELNPNAIVVMGGANFPFERIKQETFLKSHPEVDFYIRHEGEVAFVDLINRLAESGMEAEKVKQSEGIPSVFAVDKKGRPLPFAGLANRLDDLKQIPSPYTTGKFDQFFDGRLWPLIQTKRGCPFTCAYCTEGDKYYSKIARFGLEYTKAEIEYIGKKMQLARSKGGRSDLYIGDSNFGMYEE